MSMGSSRSATPAFSPTQPTSSPSPRQNVFLPIASPQQQHGTAAGGIVRGNRLISPGPAKWRTATSPSHYLPPTSFQNVVRPELVRPGVVTHQTASPGNHASAPTSVIRISPSPRVSLNSAQTINNNSHQWRTEQRNNENHQQQLHQQQQQSIILQKVSEGRAFLSGSK